MDYFGETDPVHPEPARIRVLHVDDQPDLCDLTAEFLERERDTFQVVTETSAEDGFDRLVSEEIDCVVSDYDMPGCNGLEFLEQVRTECDGLPFILFTGKGSEEIASEAISAGVTDYLQKGTGTDQYTVLANRIENAVDQSRSREALEASQRRLSLFVEQSPLGVIEWDDNFDIVGVNDAAEEILGYAESELLGCSWERLVPDSAAGTVAETVDQLLETAGGYHSVNENVRKDGDRRICEWYNRIVTDETDELVAIFSQFRDITERKEREAQLEQSTARLNALFDNSPVMINIHDGAGNIIKPNPPFCEKTGYTETELTDMTVWEIDQEIDPGEARSLWESMAVGERRELEGVYQRRDGSTFPVEVHIRRLALEGEDRFMVISRDITERKERERELERYEAIVEKADDGMYVFDEDGRFEFVNQRVVDVSGIPLEGWIDEHLSIHTDLGTLTGTEVASVKEGIAAIVDGESDEEVVELSPDVPTGIDTLELRLTPLYTGEGDTCVIGYSRDISEHAAHKTKLERLQQQAQVLMTTSTVEETAQVAVDTAQELLGAELSGFHRLSDDGQRLELVTDTAEIETAFDTVPGYDRTDTADPVGAVVWDAFDTGETVGIDDTSTHAEFAGNTPAGSGMIYPIPDQGVFIVSATEANAFDETDKNFMDILVATLTTALQRVSRESLIRERERELRETKERLDLAVEGTNTGIWEWNLETDEINWSGSLERDIGLDPGTFDGTIEAVMQRVHPDDRERIQEAIEQALENDGLYRAEIRLQHEDGGIIWSDVRGRLAEHDDSADRLIGVHQNITDRKERERELERQNRRLKEFSSIVSHDLRNPLNVANGRLELARRESDCDHLDTIRNALDRMERIIDEVLELARDGADIGATDPVDLQNAVESAWTIVADGNDGVELVGLDANADLPTIEADYNRLCRLLENLLRNSIDHGGEDLTVTVGTVDTGFYIEDDGPGISEQDREQVFDPGYSTSPDGTGLGLRIIEQIVEAHDWEIRVTDGTDGGARFEITGVQIID
ncbi:PAS domain S-box protein [Halobacteriaceae bacterium SHR40]|uniref:sensor histidine kinase n=1 Tax=Halovenus amylolytica TaxID=2500550 RepID=UPI000FE3EAF4